MKRQRTTLITGANKGIGFEVARQLARMGFRVFIGARNSKAGSDAAARISNEGGAAELLEIDVSDVASIERAAITYSQATDRLDVLVNNAGIIVDGDDSALKVTQQIFEDTLRTNTLGPLLVANAFRSLLEKSSAPRIVNVSSGGGQLHDGADGWAPAYCISKTALNGVTAQLAAALPKFAVNAVCPGWVRTEMGGAGAARSIGEGAAGIVWLADEAPQDLTGKFLRDRKEIPW